MFQIFNLFSVKPSEKKIEVLTSSLGSNLSF